MRILLVEDSEHDRMAMRRAFERRRAGDEVVEAKSADEALRLFGDSHFDLLVSDYKMSGMNGFDLCREAMRRRSEIPTILITGYGDEDLAATSIKSGIKDYIVKDISCSYLRKLASAVDSISRARFSPDAPSLSAIPSSSFARAPLAAKPPASRHGAPVPGSARRLALSESILGLLGEEDSEELLLQALRRIKAFGSYDAVALRVKGVDDFPIKADLGLGKQFVEKEMFICGGRGGRRGSDGFARRPECFCGKVLTGERIECLDGFSRQGSFWCQDLRALPSRLNKARDFIMRGACISCGFCSICIVPVKSGGEIAGALLVFDRRPGLFDRSVTEFLERIAAFFSVCCERSSIRDSLSNFGRDIDELIKRRTSELSSRSLAQDAEIKTLRSVEAGLRSANSRLEALAKNKALFLSKLSHDLRAPLTAIMGFSELLLECGLEGENAEFARLIMKRGQDMASLINEIHDLAKLESGGFKLHPELIDLKLLALDVVKGFEFQASAKGIRLAQDVSDMIPDDLFADPLRISQILSNLISNAIKFTESGSVCVKAHPPALLPSGMASIRFSVSDTGPGISKQDVDALFDDFIQVHQSKSKRREGSGLGLAISKKLVSLMNGRIWVESEPGKGSCFNFSIQLQPGADRSVLD